ncbi:hypothetical protein QAD02_000140 [Eretmocerus hayati]|uniref:Uncharacterized protein n=1 Tax=Eretmocerus hayati TaxID=131215 RepID=A0ACC2ND91_9HYME|nr:hypothetical protein QAD02_000140 [Eretmocerus hayati]
MDQGGLLGGAPVVVADPLDMTIIDKVCAESTWPDDNIVTSSTFCEQPRKLNNKLLFLTVEFADQGKDFGRMLSSLDQVTFPSRADSPLCDFEDQVSPHDPNMSSAARYSPTPNPLPSSPFHNPVVTLPEPSSPLISTTEPTVPISNGYSLQLTDQSSTPSISPSENSEDFTDSTSDELVSSVSSDLMLIQGSDLALARDFLVMQEDQMNVLNSIKLNSSLDSNLNQVSESIMSNETEDETNAQISSMKTLRRFLEQPSRSIYQGKRDIIWSKDQSNDDSNLWHEDCDSTCLNTTDCSLHGVCSIADQPVPSRAVATLPGLYLSIDKIRPSGPNNGSSEVGVFAKRNICRRTQFGPIEGVVRPYDGSKIDGLPLLLETVGGNEYMRIDVSDENSSNWMRFVRPARIYEEQNLVICQLNNGIIFLTTRNIMPNEELKAGPSFEYGKRRNLPVLETISKNITGNSSPELCIQSPTKPEQFDVVGQNLRESLGIFNQNNTSKTQLRRKAAQVSFEKYLKLEDDDYSSDEEEKSFIQDDFDLLSGEEREKENSPDSELELMRQEITQSHLKTPPQNGDIVSSTIHKCDLCSKMFSSKSKLQQHCLIHSDREDDSFTCNICLKTFMNNSSLTRHVKTHQKDRQSLECPVCKEAFGRMSTLKDFSETCLNQDETLTCPHCPKTFTSYAITRKHARGHHFDRKHECHFCLKNFPAADKLKMHMLKHSDHREFQCANCSKQFKRKDKLKDHVMRVHYAEKINKDQILLNNRAKKPITKSNSVDCDRFIYKCRRCQVGFKRRGMLVNHLAKRHPDVPPDTVPELCMPILRQTRDYYCQYCEKVYKSSSKRKAHIMKNHPGAALPPSNRSKECDLPGIPNPTFSQAAGSIKTVPQGCQWCHKQYASKAKLLQHQRKKHPNLMEPADQIPRPRSRPPPQNQNQPPMSIGAFETESIVKLEPTSSEDLQKPRIFRVVSESVGESLFVGNSGADFELLASQFARVRDMR